MFKWREKVLKQENVWRLISLWHNIVFGIIKFSKAYLPWRCIDPQQDNLSNRENVEYHFIPNSIYKARQTLFFGKYLKKKLQNIFLNFFFYLKVQSFRLIKENNFIQMAASAGLAVANTIGPIAWWILSFKASIVFGLSA